MARYIDADMLLTELDFREIDTTIQLKQGDEKHRLCQKGILSGLNWSRNIIYEIPTADVEEVKHAKWLKKRNMYECSRCSYTMFANVPSGFNYCTGCGAKMDGGNLS